MKENVLGLLMNNSQLDDISRLVQKESSFLEIWTPSFRCHMAIQALSWGATLPMKHSLLEEHSITFMNFPKIARFFCGRI